MPLTLLIYQPNYCESCSASTLCRGNHRLTPERTDLLKSCPPPLSSPRPAPLSVSLHSSLTDLIKIYPVGSLAFITTTGLMKQRIRQNQSCFVPINVHYIATNTAPPSAHWHLNKVALLGCTRLTQRPKSGLEKPWRENQPLYLLTAPNQPLQLFNLKILKQIFRLLLPKSSHIQKVFLIIFYCTA